MADRDKPSSAERKQLLAQVDRLVLAQTNVFIREFLRGLGYRPGANKAEFRESLQQAIEDGALDGKELEEWLRRIEGWGNQHVYPFTVPRSIARARAWRTRASVKELVDPVFRRTWDAPTPLDFPDHPEVARTTFEEDRKLFLIEWQERGDAWIRDEDEDRRPQIGGDPYWLKAFRLDPRRVLMRFAILLEPEVADEPIAALFVRLAVRSKKHRKAVEVAWRDLERLSLGGRPLGSIKASPWDMSAVIKTLDDDIVHDRLSGFRSRAAQFSEGLASVEFVAPPDMALPEMIRDVRLSIPQRVMNDPSFRGTKGDFHMLKDPERATSREAHVQLFLEDNRIRIWTELDEADVWVILETLDEMR